MTVTATTLETGSPATALLETVDDHYHLSLGLPKGDTGDTGSQGPKGDPGKDAVIDTTLTQAGQAADAKATGEAISSLKNDIGDAWTSGKTYAVGDYCISDNKLYKCKTAHTAGSAFNSDYWEAARICDEVKTSISLANRTRKMVCGSTFSTSSGETIKIKNDNAGAYAHSLIGFLWIGGTRHDLNISYDGLIHSPSLSGLSYDDTTCEIKYISDGQGQQMFLMQRKSLLSSSFINSGINHCPAMIFLVKTGLALLFFSGRVEYSSVLPSLIRRTS